jgi:hypothetical protein
MPETPRLPKLPAIQSSESPVSSLRTSPSHPHRLLLAGLAGIALGVMGPSQASAATLGDPPARLSETGLYAAGSTSEVRPGVAAFSPQYPLWSDGANKRRWLRLPPGKTIDASNPDAWQFPRGTQLWKEFSHDGRPVETRYIERRPDGSWSFATYLWSEDGREALLAPARGSVVPVRAAPGGRYAVPSRGDCIACHGSAAVPVLGVSALQLSPDRDPLAVHGRALRDGEVDLRALVARGWLRGLPPALLKQPPRIAAETSIERAALGYLHANCSHCHNASGNQVPLRLTLAQSAADPQASRQTVLASAVDAPSRYQPAGRGGDAQVVVPGKPQASVLVARMQSRQVQSQMPPLGSDLADSEGLALLNRWITHDLPHRKETPP